MLQSQRSFNRNGILASLSPEDFESLAPHLNPLTFNVRYVFFRPHEPIETVVFPESGFASVVATTESGRSLEVGIIGREGVIGVPVIFGQTLKPYNSGSSGNRVGDFGGFRWAGACRRGLLGGDIPRLSGRMRVAETL